MAAEGSFVFDFWLISQWTQVSGQEIVTSLKGQFHEVTQLQNQFHSNLLVPDFCIIANCKSNANLLKIVMCYISKVGFGVDFFPPKNICKLVP